MITVTTYFVVEHEILKVKILACKSSLIVSPWPSLQWYIVPL